MSLAPGTKLGPYEILSSLGAGGMGEVYRARDARLDRVVAIKVLPASLSSDPDRLQRFAQEARAAAALNHPSILSIFDIGNDAGAPFVVSELLEGETLRDRLKTGAIAVRRAVDIALQVAKGLAAAHEKGIVHRDLKPENIFLTHDGRAKILDFGLAKLTRPEPAGSGETATLQGLTEPGVVMGTVGYMSPEQVRGKPADPRSDIFSFGAILYEMISGKRAFHGESPADTMSAILKEDVPELSETTRNVPPGLERIVQHCLEKNPSQRFQSAGDLAFGLEALTGVSTTSKSGAQAVVREVQAADSRRRWAPWLGGIALALATLACGWWWGQRSAFVAPPRYQQVTFRLGSIGNARFTPDGSVIYDATWGDGQQQLYQARTDENGSRELGIKDATLLAISKNGEIALRLNTNILSGYARSGTLARVPLSGGTPRETLDNVQGADWAPDGDRMAVVRWDPEKSHWHLEYPVGKILLDSITWVSHPKISPDGKWVAFADHENAEGDDRGSVAVIGADGQEKKLAGGYASVEGIAWSPSGDEIWFTASQSGSSNNLRGVTLGGKLRTIVNVPGGMWLQDIRNGVVLMTTSQMRVNIRGIPPGGTTERELGWLGWSILRDISRDGRKILFEEAGDGGGPDYTVFLRDTDGSPPVRIGEGTGAAISPDGKWVITKPAQGGPLQLVPTGAGEARALTHDNVHYVNAHFLPDGKRLLASGIEPGHSARSYVIDLKTGDSKPLTPEGIDGTVLSPDGRNVAVSLPDGTLGVWTIGENTARPIPKLEKSYYATAWTADGKELYVTSTMQKERATKIYKVNVTTGRMDDWKTLGTELSAGIEHVSGPLVASDGRAYAYNYRQSLSQAYIVNGLK